MFGRSHAWLGRHRAGQGSGNLERHALTDLFAKLGCADPESWANSQIDEGINQLGRFLFIRQAWAEAVPFDSTGWIDNLLGNCPAATPLGTAWRRALAGIADRKDLATIVRSAQGEMLVSICRLIDAPYDGADGWLPFRWGLFEIDEAGRPVGRIGFLQEDVLGLDPALTRNSAQAR